ncbi:hypothetical protein HN784_02400 [bacterium]|nr:hypothetical protein [bacterium]MBT4250883.1 hypothetical protein [bacterium]MBT4597596.1 hypothetical protein [bacterium]MBT6754061.1 hypothetical protein [bacterium]MBT7038091.1 hypothetical protein [bacterium]
MTKYILNSGNAKYYPEKEKASIKETLLGLGDDVKVLYCFFSQPREDWETKYEKYKKGFLRAADKNVRLTFKLAFPDTFEDQVKSSDVIWIAGGDDHLIKYWLEKFDVPKIWDGKIVAASSAGSNALASSFWTCDWRECMKGFGVLPIKFIAHFDSSYGKEDPRGEIDWQTGFSELEKYGDTSLPVHALKEGDFVVFEK